MNPFVDSDEMIRDFLLYSYMFGEGDVEAFDKKMPFDIVWAASTIIFRFLKEHGYSDANMQVVRSLLTLEAFPLISVCLDIFMVAGIITSGAYGTAERNSLMSQIMLRYSWRHFCLSKPGHINERFLYNIWAIVYGDDLLFSIGRFPWMRDFNNHYYRDFCREHYDIGFVSSDKVSELKEYLTLDQISFLKRTFSLREGKYVGKLAMSSIFKMLFWCLPSKHISEAKQLVDTMDSAMNELFLHLEYDQWNCFRQNLAKIISEATDFSVESILDSTATWPKIEARLKGN